LLFCAAASVAALFIFKQIAYKKGGRIRTNVGDRLEKVRQLNRETLRSVRSNCAGGIHPPGTAAMAL